VRIEAAGVGQHPELRLADRIGLGADGGLRAVEGDAIGTDADHGEIARPVPLHFPRHDLRAGDELLGRQFISAERGAGHHVRDAVAELEQFVLLARIEESRRESAGKKGGPEAIARPAEVVADGGGVKARVDAAKQHLQPGSDHVLDGLVFRGDEVGGGRSRGGHGHSWSSSSSW
jgi:hypothetical protein